MSTQDTPVTTAPDASPTRPRKTSAAKHKRELAACKTKRQRIEYALDHLPRGASVEDVRLWLGEHGQEVPTRPYASNVVNAWRAANGVTDTNGNTILTPQLAAALRQIEQADDTQEWTLISSPKVEQPDAERVAPHPYPLVEEQTNARQTDVVSVPAQAVDQPERAPRNDAGTASEGEPMPVSTDLRSVRQARRAAIPFFYLAAIMGTLISSTTSYQFFGSKLGISGFVIMSPELPLGLGRVPLDLERLVMFGIIEVVLIGCAIAMRANVLRDGNPGSARTVAWLISGFAAFAAFSVSDTVTAGIGRTIGGPVLAMVALHLALGLDARSRKVELKGVWAQIAREVRERVLSRLGLGDDQRDALARTRDRAALKAATLAVEVANVKDGKVDTKKLAELRKALHASNVAHDPAMKARMLRELATLKNAEELSTIDQPSPW